MKIDYKEIRSYHPDNVEKEKIVVSSSRLDWEKNPMFMMEVAKEFLSKLSKLFTVQVNINRLLFENSTVPSSA